MDLSDREWKNFVIGDVFDKIVNSKSYHKNNLSLSENSIVPYVSRTGGNNGLELIVDDSVEFNINPSNTIVFGAESSMFFYEPFKYITGNKMYYIQDSHFNKYVCLFLISILNNNLKLNFGYARGMTATRLKRHEIILPVDEDNCPDYVFMEEYMRQQEKYVLDIFYEYFDSIDVSFDDCDLDSVEWGDFYINDIFNEVQRGKRLIKEDFVSGFIPFISSSAIDNGIDSFIGNENNVRSFSYCLTLANSGSVGSVFYHPYNFVASDHVTHLKNDSFDKYVYLFIGAMVSRLGEKYNFNREINDSRLKREVIMLPVTVDGEPDYDFMVSYMKSLERSLLDCYLNFVSK